MKLWRISTFTDLSGEGGLAASGRWHSLGRPIVYLADHPALALLETIVHLEVDPLYLPDEYKLLAIDIPDDIAIEVVDEPGLSTNWRIDIENTRLLGDHWAASRQTALLKVPSVLVPAAFNFVLNPLHPDAAAIKVVDSQPMKFDPRLLK
ncbi:MAG: RES family NAD+ phosphorylase [Xanthobacteraceae bacterium]